VMLRGRCRPAFALAHRLLAYLVPDPRGRWICRIEGATKKSWGPVALDWPHTAGWRLVFTDRPAETDSAEWLEARDHTSNRAEYLVLIDTLTRVPGIRAVSPACRCRVKGGLVINQMTGDRGINHPALGQLNRQATALTKHVSGGVLYRSHPTGGEPDG
jgi:hypothetical protein